ncbi:hypothetical protein H072_3617 [Dactylellina haptotyla CBS 200.50]|uniref:WIBG Mago-binding domain-containing protein n=1 Tax=Dactylellina haptotyla (strain CBS 200.50) TaxID=1284197 RepID=S8C3Y5_DACHA|nr:hypothetical protein H072_3617 [Dactylellina haptotyla CBS 200.50]
MASKEPKNPQTTTSGIQTLASGTRIIPSSVRADGTTRPERRVKPGFTPAEDVVKYQNRTAEAYRNRGSAGVPGAAEVPGAGSSSPAEKAKKKRSRKKKGTGAAGEDDKDEGEEGEDVAAVATDAPPPTSESAATKTTEAEQSSEPAASSSSPSTNADAEKKAKGLQKKIRQAQELKSRKDKGETLLPEQLDKALKLGELIRDLEKLGVTYEV